MSDECNCWECWSCRNKRLKNFIRENVRNWEAAVTEAGIADLFEDIQAGLRQYEIDKQLAGIEASKKVSAETMNKVVDV